MFRNIGLTEILIIILILVLLFGARRLPELARSIGKSLGEFKKGRKEGSDSEQEADKKPDDQEKNV